MSRLPELHPEDEHNETLLANVHPADWTNPEPAGRYNLVAVGGGTAGLVCAAGAAMLGARAALVERSLLGGDCLNTGCVPSKSLIHAARVAAGLRAAGADGSIDFGAAMERLRRVRADISRHDSARRFRDLGVDVYLGQARFAGPDSLEVEGKRLRFKRAVIATGARAGVPPIDGLADAGYLTHETVFNLTELPRRLLVIGGGPIGCELAQSFARLGSEVTIVEVLSRFLPQEDPEAAGILSGALAKDGVKLRLATTVERVEPGPAGKRVVLRNGETDELLEVDEILVGAGRIPNVDGLNLEAAGVTADAGAGVDVDDRLRTSNRRIYAAGDVALRYKFTHSADASARIVLQNALFHGRRKVSALTVPWCTYTSPEIAHVGLYEHQAAERGIEIDTYKVPLGDVDRAIVDGTTEGFVKVHVRKGRDKIVGATIVADRAGDLIGEITLAMTAGLGLGAISGVIHPYPTQAEAIRKTADLYRRSRLTPRLRRWLERWFALHR